MDAILVVVNAICRVSLDVFIRQKNEQHLRPV
jgi:hypothetical protein